MVDLKKKFEVFLRLADKNAHSRPWLVVITMHEYFRNIFPTDPHIPFARNTAAVKRIASVLDQNMALLRSSGFMGSYFEKKPQGLEAIGQELKNRKRDGEEKVQQVYGSLWDKFDVDMYLKETSKILLDRFQHSGFDFKSLRDKTILDLGCGSGRFSIALSYLTKARMVHAIDLGEESLKKPRMICKEAGIKNVEFKVADVLDIPFKSEYFDFVFCNGVLHHTKDMERGIEEMHRVLKPGSRAFLYLYGDGGLYWYSRKKMPLVMRKIPQAYTNEILRMIGMPSNRFIFSDNWYVPIERHTTKKYLERFLRKTGFSDVKKMLSGRPTDLEGVVNRGSKVNSMLWGEGENRYLLKK